ncbi:MAG: (2Fe-2S) ferredoxin domain-containing protein [Defluviitaleaceae bacterium]|nr:(2Fe-2S) ferredoxin domain-containing protein [Defluviitaleaceae bacterium]
MKKIANVEELNAMRDKLKDKIGIRHDVPNNIQVVVGMGTCGIAAGAPAVLSAVTKEVGRLNLQNVTVAHKGCQGNCENEPIVEVIIPGKEPVTYVNMNSQKVTKIIGEHVVGGKPVVEYSKYGRIKGFE